MVGPLSIKEKNKKKNSVYKNQGLEPIHQKYKAIESTSRYNPKKKQKQTICSKNKVKTYAYRTHGYEMMINNSTKKRNCKVVKLIRGSLTFMTPAAHKKLIISTDIDSN
jgi:hypothetical protein